MLSLDLFDSKYERELREGAVDQLEMRRIDILNDRMQELLARAKEPAYQANPKALAALKKQFQQVKDERDDFYKVREAGIPGNVPVEKIPGKEDLLKGKGRTYYEGAEDYAEIYSPEAIALGKRFCEHYNITDDGDVQFAVEIIDSYLDEFKATNTPVDLKKIKSGVADAFRQAYRGMGSGPNFRKRFQEDNQSPRAYGVANFQRLVKANMGGYPTVTLEFGADPQEHVKLDQRGLDLISDYYDGLADDAQKNHFIYRILPSRDETLTMLKKLGYSMNTQQELPGIPGQGQLPLGERQNQKKKLDRDNVTSGDIKTARELQKIRAQYPAARTDIEALAQAEIDSAERSQSQIGNIRNANSKQDELLKQIMDIDREQSREIDNLDAENNSLEQQLNQVQSLNDRLAQTLSQMPGTKSAGKSTKTPTRTATTRTIDLLPNAPADQSRPATAKTPKAKTSSPAMAAMARQITGLKQPAPAIDKLDAPDVDTTDKSQIEKPTSMRALRPATSANPDDFKLVAEQENPEDYDDYEDEDEDLRLRSGDYVRDTQDGEHGEVFRMQGDPYERRVRILDRDGKGWYIEPGRLTRVDPTDPDVQRYFGKKRQSMDEFDASGYDRYSIYMDDYDLEEKFSDLDDAIEAIETYKRDDPKSRYLDYNVRDLNGKVVWRNDAWQDIPKPGKIQFLPRNDQDVAEGRVSDQVDHRGDVDTSANIEVLGVDLANGTFEITYNKKPYQVKIQLFSQEGLGRWQIADYDIDIINANGKNLIDLIDWNNDGNAKTDRQIRMVNTIIAYLDTQQAGDIQLMSWRQAGIDNSTAEDLYQEIQDFYKNDKQQIDQATAWLAQNMEDAEERQVFADFVKNPVSRPARTKYIPKEYLIYVAFSYSREGNTELTPGMNLKPIQLNDPDDEEELHRKVDELLKKVQFKFDAFENKIIELADSYGLGSDPDLGSGFGQREMVWDHKTITSSSSESNKNRQQILAKGILNFRAAVEKYVASFNNTLIKIGLPGITEYSTWSGVLGNQLTDQQVRYFATPEGFANLASGKIDVAKMLDDNVAKQGVAESAKSGEYYVHTVYFKDGTKKRVRVTSDEFDVADYYNKRGQAVDRVDYDFQIHSDMSEAINKKDLVNRVTKDLNSDKFKNTPVDPNRKGWTGAGKGDYGYTGYQGHGMPTDKQERARIRASKKKGVAEAEKEPTTRQELLNRVDKIQRMMTQDRNPANLQILRKELEMLKQRYQHLKEDNDSAAVERAILNRIMVAHTDLLMKFGPDKVMQAAEEVAYNVGDVDEIGTSAYVAQVKQILGATP